VEFFTIDFLLVCWMISDLSDREQTFFSFFLLRLKNYFVYTCVYGYST